MAIEFILKQLTFKSIGMIGIPHNGTTGRTFTANKHCLKKWLRTNIGETAPTNGNIRGICLTPMCATEHSDKVFMSVSSRDR